MFPKRNGENTIKRQMKLEKKKQETKTKLSNVNSRIMRVKRLWLCPWTTTDTIITGISPVL